MPPPAPAATPRCRRSSCTPQAFEAAGALDKLEGFASFHGADFYGLPRNTGRITLQRQPWVLPESLPFGAQQLKPLCGGETLSWKLETTA